jgi:hypothetical protein
MAASRSVLTVLAVLALLAGASWPTSAQEAKPEAGKPEAPKEAPAPEGEAERDRAMRELQRLTPEQRQKVWRAVMAVMNLPEDQQTKLIHTEDERRAKVKEEIERAMKEIGTVPEERKRKFFWTYFQGRRRIEETLRKEGDERRAVLTKEFHEKLRQDFGPGSNPDSLQTQQFAPGTEPKNEPK